MNPQGACDSKSHDEQHKQQLHTLHSNINKKENIIGSSSASNPAAATTPTLPPPPNMFRIGLVLYDLKDVSKTDAIAIRAITNPASSCQLVAMSLIESSSSPCKDNTFDEDNNNNDEREMQARQWLSQNIPTSFYEYCIPERVVNNRNNIKNNSINSMSLNHNTAAASHSNSILSTLSSPSPVLSSSYAIRTMPVHFGIDGYHKMLQDDNDSIDNDKDIKLQTTTRIDAVYIIGLPSEEFSKNTFVLQALQNNKHVLLNDPRSTSYDSFVQQVEAARASQRFVQFTTMFVHHYRVQRFLDCVWPWYNTNYNTKTNSSGHHGHGVSVNHGKTSGGGGGDCIESIYALLTINVRDVDKLGGPTTTIFPFIKPGDGCLRRLARYCVLTALLLMQQAPPPPPKNKKDSKKKNDDNDDKECQDVILPISVQCTKATSSSSSDSSKKGEPISASGIVKFARGRTLTFDVAYSKAPTRQVLKVEGRHRYATMTDFVIPHPDGLSTYRLYDKKTTTQKAQNTTTSPAAAGNDNHNHGPSRPWRHADLEIVKGQALDVPSGPPQDVMMWRRFASACRSVQEQQDADRSSSNLSAASAAVGDGVGDDDRREDDEDDDDKKKITNASANAKGRQTARNFTQVAMHLKRILKALDESYYNNFIEIALDDISK